MDIPSRVRPLARRGSCPLSILWAPALQQKGAGEHAHIPHGLPPAPAVHGLPASTCLLPAGTSSFMWAGAGALPCRRLLRLGTKELWSPLCVARGRLCPAADAGSPTSVLRAGQCSAVLPAQYPCSWRRAAVGAASLGGSGAGSCTEVEQGLGLAPCGM